jgi:hypothetical protein
MQCATLRAQRGSSRYESRPLRAQAADQGRRGQAADTEASDADVRDGHYRALPTARELVEEALIEMYLAGVSVRRVEDITEAGGNLAFGHAGGRQPQHVADFAHGESRSGHAPLLWKGAKNSEPSSPSLERDLRRGQLRATAKGQRLASYPHHYSCASFTSIMLPLAGSVWTI